MIAMVGFRCTQDFEVNRDFGTGYRNGRGLPYREEICSQASATKGKTPGRSRKKAARKISSKETHLPHPSEQ